MQTRYLFVYGSLLSGFKSPAYEYISRFFTLVGPAFVTGTLYDLGDYPAGLPIDTGRTIKGELYEIQKPAELSFALAQLDDYEGLHPEEGETALYKRAIVDVPVNGGIIPAWIYWFDRDVTSKPIVDSGDSIAYFRNKGSQGTILQ